MSKLAGTSFRLAVRKHFQALFGNTVLAVMVCAGLALVLGAISVGAAQHFIVQDTPKVPAAETAAADVNNTDTSAGQYRPSQPASNPTNPTPTPPPETPPTEQIKHHPKPTAATPTPKPKASIKIHTDSHHTQLKGSLQLTPGKPPLNVNATLPVPLPGLQGSSTTIQLTPDFPLEVTITGGLPL